MKERAQLFVSFKFMGSFYMINIDENRETKNSLVIKAIDVDKADFYKEYIVDHQVKVADACLKIADRIGLNRDNTHFLVQGALLHDVGKFFVPEDLLMKKGPLTEKEYEKVKKHVEYGVEYLESRHFTEEIVQTVRHHHERYDGTGYPDGLKGVDIPLQSRIIAVVDAYDAMIYGRNYKAPMSKNHALKELKTNAWSQFDPAVVHVFKLLLKEREAAMECSR